MPCRQGGRAWRPSKICKGGEKEKFDEDKEDDNEEKEEDEEENTESFEKEKEMEGKSRNEEDMQDTWWWRRAGWSNTPWSPYHLFLTTYLLHLLLQGYFCEEEVKQSHFRDA